MDKEEVISFRPIGRIHSPHTQPKGTPIQPIRSGQARGRVEIFEPYVEGLADLEGFERIWLVYWFHLVGQARLTVTPFLDTRSHGVFSTRAPCRPNPIGISCVRLLGREGGMLEVEDIDVVDATPLLDVKPYVHHFDRYDVSRCGWIDAARAQRDLADERFED
jgi:tRNA-Thr(GGU) m(6)t(6)A37 methyltransferase TsaA